MLTRRISYAKTRLHLYFDKSARNARVRADLFTFAFERYLSIH